MSEPLSGNCISCGEHIENVDRAFWTWRGHMRVLGPSCSAKCHQSAIIEDRGFKPKLIISNGEEVCDVCRL